MKTAPITYTEIAVIGGVVVLGYFAYRAYNKVSDTLSNLTPDAVISATATAVDVRAPDQNPNALSLGGVQQAVSNAVQRGQDAGASNFLTAYFTGLFK